MNTRTKATLIAILAAAGTLTGVGSASAACMGNGIDDITGDPCTPHSSGETQPDETLKSPRAVPMYDEDGNVTGYGFDHNGDGKSNGDDVGAAHERSPYSSSTAPDDN